LEHSDQFSVAINIVPTCLTLYFSDLARRKIHLKLHLKAIMIFFLTKSKYTLKN